MFDPYLYEWSNTEGHPRTLGQLYYKWKDCSSKNIPANVLQPEGSNIEVVLEKAMEMIFDSEDTETPSYIQIKLE